MIREVSDGFHRPVKGFVLDIERMFFYVVHTPQPALALHEGVAMPSKRLMPSTSLLLQDMVSTPKMREIWTEENMIQKWIDVERAIVEAQAELGMIPDDAAREIQARLSLEHLHIEEINRKRETVVHLMVSFLKTFRETCGPAAEHLHVGPTTQDILDTSLTLQMKEAHRLIMQQMLDLERHLCDRAMEHRDTVMMGRTHQQQAVPVTIGFLLATWASEIADHIDRAEESEKRWQLGVLSGVVGAQNTFVELTDAATARELERRVCRKLGLRSPLIDLHTRTDRFAEVVANISQLCSSLGKMAMNLTALQRSEVMEVQEPYGENQHSSSTNPNKVNPEASEHVEGLAKVVRGHALAMMDLQMLDNRDGTRLPVEYATIPSAYMMGARALATMIRNIQGLVVQAENMRKNLDHPNVLGQTAAERLMIAVYRKTGLRDKAHTLLHQCARESTRKRRPFKDIVMETEELANLFSPEEIDSLFDLTTYTGSASLQVEEAVRFLRHKRQRGPEPFESP
jgi:adenylosuccinate lyase